MAKILQLLRSNTVYGSKALAVDALKDDDFLAARQDGEIVLARYTYNSETKSIMGVYHVSVPLTGEGTKKTGVTILEDNSDIDDILASLDYDLTADDNKVVTDVNQENGLVSATNTNLTAIKLAGYTEGTDADIAATDTLGEALGKLQAQINAMDLAQVGGGNGDVITTVSEADGKVSASKSSLSDVLLTGYSKTNDTGAIAATDSVEVALSKIENQIAANTVSSNDKTIVIDTTGSTTDLAVNIDNTTLVKNSTTGVIKADLQVAKLTPSEVTALSDNNVAEAYKLIYATDTNRTAIGDVVKIYKDSALKEVYLGASTDTIDANTGVITKNTVTDPQSMNFAYQLADGTYSLTKIDVSKFLTESEFSDGLQVSNAVVSVKKDTTSGKVITAYAAGGNTESDVLTISSDGIKIANIQEAINAAIGTLDTADSAVAGQYISQVVETDGKLTISRANVSDAVLTGYAKGEKPLNTAVAATDDVKGAIAKLEHQIDDAEAAATTVVQEGTDAGNNMTIVETAGSDGHKIFTVNLADVASATEVDNIETAVGLNADGTKATVTGQYTASASTVEGEIDALDDELQKALKHVTGSNAISTGSSTASTQAAAKDQTISLILDSTTATTNQTCTGTNALQITSDGLFLSSTWDCGTW